MDTHDAISEAARRIAERFAPEQIILFGSRARGEATADSDADLLVVMQVLGSRREAAVAIDLVLTGIPVPTDVIVVTPKDIEKWGNTMGTLIYEAVHEGKVIYERAA